MDKTEQRIVEIIDYNRNNILDFGRDIYNHAELGYREFRTSGHFSDKMRDLGLTVKKDLAITGVKAYLNSDNKGPSVALLGEMDGLPIPDHPHANPDTGAAHACGHHCQLTGVYGAATALADPQVASELDGNVIFFAVPAEEYVELDYKDQLIREGRIGCASGKCELIRLGMFDDVDMCITHHTAHEISFGVSSENGCLSKKIDLIGKAAHAAAAPHQGINALSAASLGLQALAFNRECFAEQDGIRINTIITDGGSAPGIIPEKVTIDAMVRAKTIEAMEMASLVTDRCFQAGAAAMGAGIRIRTKSAFLPGKATVCRSGTGGRRPRAFAVCKCA